MVPDALARAGAAPGQVAAIGIANQRETTVLWERATSSSEVYGTATTVLPGTPIAAALGDQRAALFGQTCFAAGGATCTYGNGSFLLLNTCSETVHSGHGLLTTAATSSATSPPSTPSRGPSRSPGRWCSGSATGSG